MKRGISIICASLLILAGCSKKDTSLGSVSLTDFMNLQQGKYIIYRLDSTNYINFGQQDTVTHYQAKDVISQPYTDNQGRKGWTVIRYLRDTASTSEADWQASITYVIVPTRSTIEVIENNMRFQKLKLPVSEGFNWKGNSFIDTRSAFSEVPFLDDWDYTYTNLYTPFTVFGNQEVDSTVTVDERDELLGEPSDKNSYSERTLSTETYAKGIGLVYRNFLHWEYQPPTGSNAGYTNGYGIRLTMIDHN